ncbi:molybdenum cofactor biosynthesis F family protein [Phytoactinopolyspora limicola]|uniref:molybdenum cofactor biosynthesis F family protein n=1 Tax=Phytoactinopolyspora limicola TaxID=2715536 RepID=UPI001408F3E8|nr:molybdenum cofactor biosynthesis F family protein [Phytoactinopolyspora limicola]
MSETINTATTASSLSDTSTWLPLDGLAPGFDANKGPSVADLAGRTVVVENPGGTVITHRFGPDRVDWDYAAAPDDPHGDEQGADDYEAFAVDDELYYVQFHSQVRPGDAVSLLLDMRSGHALSVVTTIGSDPTAVPRVTQSFVAGRIRGVDENGPAPAPTTSLVGRRAVWVYSSEHAYEHVYLSPHWYTWQCLSGPELGLADTDENSTYQLRPGIYVFAWREKVIPCASVTVADHRDAHRLRSHGVLFGLDSTGQAPTHFTFGAWGRLLSTTVHPPGLDPAGPAAAQES